MLATCSNSSTASAGSSQSIAARFSRKCRTDEVPGDQKNIGRTTKQPRERDLHGRGAEALSDVGQGRRLQRIEPAERKERHIGDAVAGQFVDQGIVVPMRQIVLVLHADDLGDPTSFRHLLGRDVAQPDVTH